MAKEQEVKTQGAKMAKEQEAPKTETQKPKRQPKKVKLINKLGAPIDLGNGVILKDKIEVTQAELNNPKVKRALELKLIEKA